MSDNYSSALSSRPAYDGDLPEGRTPRGGSQPLHPRSGTRRHVVNACTSALSSGPGRLHVEGHAVSDCRGPGQTNQVPWSASVLNGSNLESLSENHVLRFVSGMYRHALSAPRAEPPGIRKNVFAPLATSAGRGCTLVSSSLLPLLAVLSLSSLSLLSYLRSRICLLSCVCLSQATYNMFLKPKSGKRAGLLSF